MAVTRNTYTGNGSTTNYSFTFPYLEATDIKVSVNGTTTTAYTLANATTIQFNTAPANGASIAIYRQTDDTALSAAFYPGSAIRSADLNDNFTQNLYVTQESNRDATDAIGYGQQAISTANGAVSTANAATATANTASSNASAAVATANTASTNASAAVSTANTASSNATSAVNTANAATATANSAAADAATAISTANSAVSTANSAVSTANSAVTTAGNAVTSANSAVSTATTAATNAANAVSTANAANTTSGNALTTANNAVTTANSAVSTANAADTKANQAINAVANALLFDIVANVAAIPASPANQDAVEITNSTGIQSFTPLAGLPAGFVGDAGLSVRLLYQSAGSTWTWLQYFPNDPDNRYAGPNTDAGTAAAPSIAFGPTDPNTGIFSPGADEFGIATGGVGRFFIDAAGNVVVATALSVNGEDVVVDNDARLTDTRTPTDNTVSTSKIVDGAVTSAKIADGTIIDGDISATAGIAPSKISGTAVVDNDARLTDQRTPVDGSVTTAKIADAAVTTAKVADGSITGAKLAAGAAVPADGSITTAKLADGSVTSGKLAGGAVTANLGYTPDRSWTATTTGSSKTLSNFEHCVVTASGQTITLPASPSSGWEVAIGVGAFTNTVVARNGQNIMGLSEDMTIDRSNVTATLFFVDSTRGWRIV